jgi:hypothetical protein
MAMDALKNISTNVPDWLHKLGDLGEQIERRQAELAALAPASPPRSIKSVKKTGSTESLRPRDEEHSEPITPFTFKSPCEPKITPLFPPATPPYDEKRDDEMVASPKSPTGAPPSPGNPTSTEIKQQSKRVFAVAQAHARAQVRRRHQSQSVVSVEGHPGAYRSRSMIIVYYDSFVQTFFEELVKFVSASRNLMRRAKMAAKVAHIKRLAEMETPAGDDDDDDDDDDIKVPSMRYFNVRRAGAMPFARAGTRGMMGNAGPADCYDELDKALEYVQGLAEKAAHQFLRDGDCNEEIGNISRKLCDTKGLAEKEMERILREEPEMASQPEPVLPRTHRPPAVRREFGKEVTSPPAKPRELRQPVSTPPVIPDAPLEADTPMEVDPVHITPEKLAAPADPTIPPALEPEPDPAMTANPLVAVAPAA